MKSGAVELKLELQLRALVPHVHVKFEMPADLNQQHSPLLDSYLYIFVGDYG